MDMAVDAAGEHVFARRVDHLLRALEPGREGDHLAARDADVRRERVRRRRDRAAPDDRVVSHGFLLQASDARPASASAARRLSNSACDTGGCGGRTMGASSLPSSVRQAFSRAVARPPGALR